MDRQAGEKEGSQRIFSLPFSIDFVGTSLKLLMCWNLIQLIQRIFFFIVKGFQNKDIYKVYIKYSEDFIRHLKILPLNKIRAGRF